MEGAIHVCGGGGEQIEDLELTDLVTESLAGIAGEEGGFLPGGGLVQGQGAGEEVGCLVACQLAGGQFEVGVYAQGPQVHAVGEEGTVGRGLVEQAGLQHEIFVVKA